MVKTIQSVPLFFVFTDYISLYELAKIQCIHLNRPSIPKSCGNKLYLLDRSASELEPPLTARLPLLYCLLDCSLDMDCRSSYAAMFGVLSLF